MLLKKLRKIQKKKAQVWVETVVYTLIGLTVIAILLAVAKPQIENIKDKATLEQTIVALNNLDNVILEIEQAAENTRVPEFTIRKGRLEINPEGDFIKYTLENTGYKFSEVGEIYEEGRIEAFTKEKGKRFDINLTMNYRDTLDFTYDGGDRPKILQAGTTPYKIHIKNVGDNSPGENVHIDFKIL